VRAAATPGGPRTAGPQKPPWFRAPGRYAHCVPRGVRVSGEGAPPRAGAEAAPGAFAASLARARAADTARSGSPVLRLPGLSRLAAAGAGAKPPAPAARPLEAPAPLAADLAPRDAPAVAPLPELPAVLRVLPPAAAALAGPGRLALSFGPSLEVDLRATAAGVEVVLRPEPRLVRAAEAELPRVVAALRARGVAVARAEVRRGAGRAR
jgi:hypothetical protein